MNISCFYNLVCTVETLKKRVPGTCSYKNVTQIDRGKNANSKLCIMR